MITRVFSMPGGTPDHRGVAEAAAIIKAGGLVAFPTETVYGLGANGLDGGAVEKIFAAKGRPGDNPLILHICEISAADEIADHISEDARRLMRRFWPGPLTLVLKKRPIVPDGVTAGLDTVAVRMPRSAIALALIREAGVPIAAPSANRSTRPSPTDAGHVLEDLDGRIDALIDAGNVEVGVESTVLDMSGSVPAILRPGGVTFEMLREFLTGLRADSRDYLAAEEEAPRAPGMKYAHYSPKARVIIVKGGPEAAAARIGAMAAGYEAEGLKCGILATDETAARYAGGAADAVVISAGARSRPETIAASLFESLRRFDALGCDVILAEAIDRTGIGAAVMNRLEKAAAYDIVDADR